MGRFAALLALLGIASVYAQSDPYRWMEGPTNPKFADWLHTQPKKAAPLSTPRPL